MSYAIILVLISLFFNGCSDVTFKKYSTENLSKGMLIAGTGAVWAIWQSLYLYYFQSGSIIDQTTVSYGLICGVILVLANILLLECLTHLEISLGSIIYRLNTIGVVVLSFFFLDENLGLHKIIGIFLGIIAAYILYHPGKGNKRPYLSIFLFLIIIAAIFRASYGVVAKIGISEGANVQSMILFTAICWVIGGLAYCIIKEKRLKITYVKGIYMCISGTLIFITVATLMQAISLGQVNTILPIANCSFIVALILSVVLKLENMNGRKVFAIMLGCSSIFMLAQV